MTRFALLLPRPSRRAICGAKIVPIASPSVAIPMVNQNDVRTTVSLCDASGASK